MDEWRASLTEYRIAWITAFGGIALIFLVSAWPELFTIKQNQTQAESMQPASTPAKAETARKPVEQAPPAPAAAEQRTEAEPVEQLQPKVIDAKKTPAVAKEEPAPPAQKPAAKPAAPSGGYYVQTGAFKDAAGAKAVAGKLKQRGWPAIVVPKAGLYAVWAGPQQSREAIEKLQQDIQRGLGLKGFIVQKKPS